MSGRLRGQSGFGLIELLMAMVMLNIGLLAVVAAFTSGIFGLARAANVSTAAALGDQQMELYRELPYACIYMPSPPSTQPYTDAAAGYLADYQVTSGTIGYPTVPQCNILSGIPADALIARRTGVQGPDKHHTFEVDTYINYRCSATNGNDQLLTGSKPTGTTPGTCALTVGRGTLVTVTVRDGNTSKILNTQSSMFVPDPTTGY